MNRLSPRRLIFRSSSLSWALFLASALAAQQEDGLAGSSSGAPRTSERATVSLEGLVLALDGSPAEGVSVQTSAGGHAVTDARGVFRLALGVPPAATSVQLTAFGPNGANLVARASVGLSGASGRLQVDPLQLAQGAACAPDWRATFGAAQGVDSWVYALAVHDAGNGPELVVGGEFRVAGGVSVSGIASWDGERWSPVGPLRSGFQIVVDLVSFDDGSGPALYAALVGGGSPNPYRLEKWDGVSWSTLGGQPDGEILTLAVHDDGSGPSLYAAGAFTTIGGVTVHHVARWDGLAWTALGGGTSGEVHALIEHDDGSGPALYAGGRFATAGGVAVQRIARWQGGAWSALGSGVDRVVRSLGVHDDGSGPVLVAGGEFTQAGGTSALRVATWDGASWSALGAGVPEIPVALADFDDGTGSALFVACERRLFRWAGSAWTEPGGGLSFLGPEDLATYDDGDGAKLFAGGRFTSAGGQPADGIVGWDGSAWSTLGRGLRGNVPAVYALASVEGTASGLYAGGTFTHAGDRILNHVARWDSSGWSALGTGLDGPVEALVAHDDGSGPALYAGGHFIRANGAPARRIARWDGTSWSRLGTGMDDDVLALAVHDDGGGPALFAAGRFTKSGGVFTNRVAKWDGLGWSALGSGVDLVTSDRVTALASYDDGNGPALYIGGHFFEVGGVAAVSVARWDGIGWSALGGGPGYTVEALAVFDDGTGPVLFAGLGLNQGLARWDGTAWLPRVSANSAIEALVTHDDGSGLALYVGGSFTVLDGLATNRIARWDGTSWSALAGGLGSYRTLALAMHEVEGAPSLIVGGDFRVATGDGDSYVARWGCPDGLPPVLTCPASIVALDRFADGLGESVFFEVSASDGLDPEPVVTCVPPSGSHFPPGTTLVTCTAVDASGNQSSCQFPVTVEPKARRR